MIDSSDSEDENSSKEDDNVIKEDDHADTKPLSPAVNFII